MRLRPLAAVAVAATLATTVVACSSSGGRSVFSSPGASGSGGGAYASPTTWTGNEQRYGGDFVRTSDLTYQPDVVLLEHGADAVRSVSADGLVWTLDARAPGVSDLQVGKVMLATTFGAGRVLALNRTGDDEQVVLGPATLTDIISDGTLESAQPIPLPDQPLYYDVTLPQPPEGKQGGDLRSDTPPLPTPPIPSIPIPTLPTATLPPPATAVTNGSAGDFFAIPNCCGSGVGLNIQYHKNGGSLNANVKLKIAQPTATFKIAIGHGSLLSAAFALHGQASLSYDFQAANLSNAGNVVTWVPIDVPNKVTIPLGGGPVPLVVTFSQHFTVTLQLGGRAELDGSGSYSIDGDLGFGSTGSTARQNPVSMSVQKPILHNIGSLTVGLNSLKVSWGLRASVGVGLLVGSVGAWFQLNTALVLTATGLTTLNPGCRTGALSVGGQFGIGYTIADFILPVVNGILGFFHVPPIPAVGGIPGPKFTIFDSGKQSYCAPLGSGGGGSGSG